MQLFVVDAQAAFPRCAGVVQDDLLHLLQLVAAAVERAAQVYIEGATVLLAIVAHVATCELLVVCGYIQIVEARIACLQRCVVVATFDYSHEIRSLVLLHHVEVAVDLALQVAVFLAEQRQYDAYLVADRLVVVDETDWLPTDGDILRLVRADLDLLRDLALLGLNVAKLRLDAVTELEFELRLAQHFALLVHQEEELISEV